MGWYKAGHKETIHIADNKETTEKGSALDARQANRDIEGTLAYDIYKEISETKKSASDGKTAVAAAITAMNQATASSAAYSTMAANIRKISNDATAGAGHILEGETAYTGGRKVTGEMTGWGAVTHSLPANGSYTIPEGYHNGSGKITQRLATQAARTIMPGTYDQGVNQGTYLSGPLTVKGDANLAAANIVRGKSIFGVNGSAGLYDRLKFTLGQRVALVSILSKTNISFSGVFTGGPDGAKWYNWCVPSGKVGKVVFSTGGFLESAVSKQWGAVIRSIEYSTDAQAAGKNGYSYGPVYYDDYWVPGKRHGLLDSMYEGSHKRIFAKRVYSFDWTNDAHDGLVLSFANVGLSGETWTQQALMFYPVTAVEAVLFDAYDGSGFNSRDTLGASKGTG